jgi:hypothetical protein
MRRRAEVRGADGLRDLPGALLVAPLTGVEPVLQLHQQVLRPEAEKQHHDRERQVGQSRQHVAEGPGDPGHRHHRQQHDRQADDRPGRLRARADPLRAALEPVVQPAKPAQVQQPRGEALQQQADDEGDEIHVLATPGL